MSGFSRLARRMAARLIMAFALAAATLPAWAATYVDVGLADLTEEQKVKVTEPKPVQLLFQFQTKGKPNGRATKQLKEQVGEIVQASGLFSRVSEGPVEGGAVVSVTIDNVPEEGAASKGVGVGLTFGLAGTMVTDYYVCTVEYLPPGGETAKVVATANHALHTTIGLRDAPPNGVKAKNIMEAVNTMVRQIVGHALNTAAADPGFAGAGVMLAAEPEAPDWATLTPGSTASGEPLGDGLEVTSDPAPVEPLAEPVAEQQEEETAPQPDEAQPASTPEPVA